MTKMADTGVEFAFPCESVEVWNSELDRWIKQPGMSKLEYYAGCALQGFVANPELAKRYYDNGAGKDYRVEMAVAAFDTASAMVEEELKRRGGV